MKTRLLKVEVKGLMHGEPGRLKACGQMGPERGNLTTLKLVVFNRNLGKPK